MGLGVGGTTALKDDVRLALNDRGTHNAVRLYGVLVALQTLVDGGAALDLFLKIQRVLIVGVTATNRRCVIGLLVSWVGDSLSVY